MSASPPATFADGATRLAGQTALAFGWTTPTGDWSGQARKVAGWTAGGWRFVVPWPGFTLRVGPNLTLFRYDGSNWTAAPAVSAPTGGAIVDGEARAAIAAIQAALMVHGLLTPA